MDKNKPLKKVSKEKSLEKATEKTIRKYNRFSYIYDILEKPMEASVFTKWRSELIKPLKGNILEIGVGTGKNLIYYNKKVNVTAIDISPGMLSKAKNKLKDINNKNIKLIEMDAQNLKFKDNSFDYVICTFVLCSVPDPVKALKEMKRVCKKDGKILMIEHMLSKNKLIAFFEHLHNPITRTLFGFNVNRKTDENVVKAGLKIIRIKNLAFFDVFRRIEAGK
ncbi:MAG: methyltransferase domain-containing protein [Nanoarchaeota archaeon]